MGTNAAKLRTNDRERSWHRDSPQNPA